LSICLIRGGCREIGTLPCRPQIEPSPDVSPSRVLNTRFKWITLLSQECDCVVEPMPRASQQNAYLRAVAHELKCDRECQKTLFLNDSSNHVDRDKKLLAFQLPYMLGFSDLSVSFDSDSLRCWDILHM
jgi:hypothetical protein